MSDELNNQEFEVPVENTRKKNNYFLHIGLFILTVITTICAGVQWTTGIMEGPYDFTMWKSVFLYSFSIIFIIACHEFGHYFVARIHMVFSAFLFFIPSPPIPM